MKTLVKNFIGGKWVGAHSGRTFDSRDPATGDVILSRRPESWEDFFALTNTFEVPEDFLADRRDTPPQKRRLF